MVDGLHLLIWNRTKKPTIIAFSGVRRGLRERDNGGDLTNVQWKTIRNGHYKSALNNEYILIKKRKNILKKILYTEYV
jgi:hypothetical protein